MARRRSDDSRGDILQGTLDMLVLRTLLFGPAHGHSIAHAIERSSDDALQVEHGSLYPALYRLEGKGLVSSRLGSGTPIRSGRPRRFYRLRPNGVRALNDARAAVEGLWRGIKWPLEGSL